MGPQGETTLLGSESGAGILGWFTVEAGDLELCAAWRQGDAAAGNALVKRHFVGVYRFFRSKIPDNADELTQKTFLACVEARERFREGAGFKPYLYGIARNMLLRHFERRGRSVEAEALSRLSIADLAPSPSRAVAQDQRRALLLDALRRLPVDFQIVIELAYWEQMSQKDVAEVLGVATGTVKSRLFRARERLGEELAKVAEHGRVPDIEAETQALAESFAPPRGSVSGVDRWTR